MNLHHRRAAAVLVVTAVLDVALGVLYGLAERIHILHGMYCAVATATTVGCDIPPDNGFSYVLSAVMMLTVVPLFAAVFSFFTSGLTADHVDTRHEQIKEHLSGTQRLPEAGE
ncbi:MAG TPA: hypothetical protein VHE33_13175 [Acidobacteriaceae bacterium]|nr:hypothetical protein [Acidobacteriaceae bacterium]